MDSFVRQGVDYRQYQVRSAPYWRTGMEIFVVGDDLLHAGSSTECTGFAATHTGGIQMRVIVRDGPPDEISDDWDAISETTLWCPHGELSVHALMGGSGEGLDAIGVPPGLIRIRAHARDRIHEVDRTDADPPEQHELVVWPVSEEIGPLTLREDHIVTMPTLARRLPVGDRSVHLTRTGANTFEWRWAGGSAALPDDRPSVVRIGNGSLRHEGVLGRHAVMLGLIWDHLLERDPDEPPAWERERAG